MDTVPPLWLQELGYKQNCGGAERLFTTREETSMKEKVCKKRESHKEESDWLKYEGYVKLSDMNCNMYIIKVALVLVWYG